MIRRRIDSAPPVIRDGLAVLYLMSARQGRWIRDWSGNGFHAQFNAGADEPAWSDAGVAFTSTDYAISPPMPDTLFVGDITVSAVVRFTEIDPNPNRQRGIIGKSSSSDSPTQPFQFRTDSSSGGALIFYRANAGVHGTRSLTPQLVALNAWHMYTAKQTPPIENVATFHLDDDSGGAGSALNAGTGTPSGTSAPIRIGNHYPSGGITTQHQIAAILIYSRSLSAGEVQTNYRILRAYLKQRGVSLP